MSAESVPELVLSPPDDFHCHVREGKAMDSVLPDVAARFRRAIIMPNLVPPVVTTQQAVAYRDAILASLKSKGIESFVPLMTLYLTDKTPPEEIYRAKESGVVFAVKFYPAGATTNSDSGVTDIKKVYPTLEVLSKVGMPLLIHGEVTTPEVDIFERESVFLEQHLKPIVAEFPELKVVAEHITTKVAVDYITAAPANVGATITAHHLMYNRNRLFQGGLNPHYYCLPVLKTEQDRLALVAAATSGNPKFFAGTDSAPHAVNTKHTDCCRAGCYTSFAAVELYAESFESVGALDKLQPFLSEFGAKFYGIPLNADQSDRKLILRKERWNVPTSLPFGESEVIPLRAKEAVSWKLAQSLI